MKYGLCLAALAGTLAASTASAQVTFNLVKAVDLFNFSTDATNPLFVGNNPCAIALNGNRMYIVGWNFTGARRRLPVIQIDDWTANSLASRVFPNGGTGIPSQLEIPNGRGYSGLDYLPGAGLVVSGDYNASFTNPAGGTDPYGQYMVFNVDSQLNPILVARPSDVTSPMGKAGTAWDAGVDGLGYAYTGGSGPIVAALDNNTSNQGPLGLNPLTLDASVGATVYEPPTGPVISGAPQQSTLWRDIDIHPTNGTIVARGGNNVIIAPRLSNLVVDTVNRKVINLSTDGIPFVAGQNIQVLNGLPSGDLFAYTDRRSTGGNGALSSVIKFADFAGNDQTGTVVLNGDVDLDRTGPNGPIPVASTTTGGVGFYDISWDAANQRLAILDYANRFAYVFALDTGNNCPADFNSDGFVDDTDFVIFAQAYDQFTVPPANPATDLNGDSFVDDTDFVLFAQAYDQFVCP